MDALALVCLVMAGGWLPPVRAADSCAAQAVTEALDRRDGRDEDHPGSTLGRIGAHRGRSRAG